MVQPINPPIYWSSIFEFETSEALIDAARKARERFTGEASPDPLYTRWDNPTVRYVEEQVAYYEGTEDALAFGSGMAAISSTVLAFLEPGDTVLTIEALYGGTMEFFRTLLPRWGFRVEFFDPFEDNLEATFSRVKPRIVYVESPTNPTLMILPLKKIADLAHEVPALSVIDNTFATPVLQNPADMGFDLVLHSATKALCGHHDVMGGFVAGPRRLLEKVWSMRKLLGGIMDPMAAYMMYRGMATLEIRVIAQSMNAMKIAEFLKNHPMVERVYYPGLPDDPGHAQAKEQMRLFGTMVSFRYRGNGSETSQMIDRLTRFHRAGSLGGVDSLVTQPATTSHLHVDPAIRERVGVTDNLVRLSIGLEPVDLLIEDLDQALSMKVHADH